VFWTIVNGSSSAVTFAIEDRNSSMPCISYLGACTHACMHQTARAFFAIWNKSKVSCCSLSLGPKKSPSSSRRAHAGMLVHRVVEAPMGPAKLQHTQHTQPHPTHPPSTPSTPSTHNTQHTQHITLNTAHSMHPSTHSTHSTPLTQRTFLRSGPYRDVQT
jgi:hypothetical protein